MTIYLQQKGTWLNSDVETPISLFLDNVGAGSGVLLESAEVDGRWGRYSLVASNFLLTLSCVDGLLKLAINDERFTSLLAYENMEYTEGLRQVMRAININPDPDFPLQPPITRGLYGYMGYGLAGILEKKLASKLPPAEAEGVFVLPGQVFLFDHTYNRLACLDLVNGRASRGGHKFSATEQGEQSPAETVELGPITCRPEREQFINNVKSVKELIYQGEAVQVVISTGFQASFKGDLFNVYRRLRQINPSPYMFYFNHQGFQLAVSSPEVMVSCNQDKLRLCPIAGTRPRGETLMEDSLFEADLTSDPKEQAEHVMLVDLGRNDLGMVAATGSVRVDRYMEVERFSHVMHLTSYLGADLEEGREALDVIRATFPAGTLSGAPKVRAMEIIADFENKPRGPYGGAMGWLGLDKDKVNLDLGITIRCLWARHGQVNWQAGAGVVYDSQPEMEWEECLNKSKVLRRALEEAGCLIKQGEC